MANTLTAVTDRLLVGGLQALRQQAFMPLVVNRSYDTVAGEKGSTVDVPIPSAIEAQDVTPANTPPTTADAVPTSVSITMDQWKEAPFYLTDKDMAEVSERSNFLPMQSSEAIKTLANAVNTYIFSKMYKRTYGFAGTAGTTPFASDTTAATAVRKVLNNQLAPMDPRYMIMDPDAEANALNLRAFQDASFGGGSDAILNGQINQKLGFRWMMHQLVPTHTKGTGASMQTAAAGAVGDATIAIDTGTGTLTEGDIITFAGHSQTYVVTAAVANVASATIAFSPPLVAIVADNAAITLKASHVVNLAFHRDAFAFATRPLANTDHPASIVRAVTDEMSGLTLRLEITREHKRNRFSYDILYGGALVRPELAARLAG